MQDFFLFVFVLAILAVILREETIVTLLYLFTGAYIVARWWSGRAFKAVTFKRTFADHVFPGERVTVRLQVANTGWLPVVWLRLHDSLPVEVAPPRVFREVVTLGSHERTQFEYTLHPYKRGYYRIGPLFLSTGDLFGLGSQERAEETPDFLTVYPRVVSLTSLALPSRSPLGTLRHTQPVFEDPTRVMGKRDYVSGDSLRRVDWKTTAVVGRLQVKQFEPSIALETMILLNLNASEYDARFRLDSTELAIVVAASIANWVAGQKQAVGLIVNGADPLQGDNRPPALPARKGRNQLMRLLEVLARIQMSPAVAPLAQLLRQEIVNLPWGTTLVVISGTADEPLMDALFQASRAGLSAVLIFAGMVTGLTQIQRRMERFGFPVYQIARERDLDIWRR